MNTGDLCDLVVFNEESVLQVIKERFELDNIYTYIGDFLLSVNPYKDLQIYSKEDYQNSVKKCSKYPHIYHLASHIHQSMLIGSDHQCFIISGEAGSGKTETTKYMVKHFLSLCSMDDRKLIDKILMANRILEAFGSAKTNLNDSSTRFAKFLQIYFSTDGKVCGANITEYLLEKSRVTDFQKGEQNFHVFYYLFAGRTEEELSKHLIGSPIKHRYLKYGEAFGEDIFGWSQNYNVLLEGLTVIGFSPEEICGIFGVLSAILNLGDISFNSEEDGTGVYIENLDVLDKVAILLGVVAEDLEICLTSNLVTTGDDAVSSFKNTPEAHAGREALAQLLYARLFGWIVSRLNDFLNPVDPKKKKSEYLSIGFLDMFGFEDIENNSVEQLCINVANEQLQHHFTQYVFALEQLEFQDEEVEVDPFPYRDNKNIINLLLEKPHGIFALLEDESKCLQADTNTLVSSLNAHCSQNVNYIPCDSTSYIFGIIHYTRKVDYMAEGLLLKNVDKLDPSIMDCLKYSNDNLTSLLFQSSISRTGSLSVKTSVETLYHGDLRESYEKSRKRRLENERGSNTNKASINVKTKQKKTTYRKGKPLPSIVSQFRVSLVNLMEKILLCQAHFVRCIKPNKKKESGLFDSEFVMEQIRYLGIVETIKIRKLGFPVRLPFKVFLDRYQILSLPPLVNAEPSAENCGKVLDAYGIGWRAGKTKIFLQLKEAERLTQELRNLTAKVVMAQKMVRGHLARIDFDFLQTNRKQEERNLGNLLVSISSKSTKMYDNLLVLNEADMKMKQEKKDKELKKKETEKENQIQKRKLNNSNESNGDSATKGPIICENSPTRKVPKNKSRPPGDIIMRNFTQSSMSAWCRVDCYERQYHIASFHMDQAVICVDGTQPVSDKNRISFASLQSHWDDPKVAKVKSCIGKGVQMHQDEKQNLWATRLGKNPIYVRGHTLCPELVKLNGKLTQGVPMKVLDTAAFKEDMKREVDMSGVNDEVKEKIMSRLKVCMSFIKDTVVDEETPCWFEIWLLKVKDSVKRYLDNYQKRRDHEEKRKSLRQMQYSSAQPTSVQTSLDVPSRNAAPPMRRCKSGDQLKTNDRRSRAQSINQRGGDSPATKIPRNGTISQNGVGSTRERTPIRQPAFETETHFPPKLPPDSIRREKSMDVRLEQRLLRGDRNHDTRLTPKKKSSAQNSPEQSMDRTESIDSKNSRDSTDSNTEQLDKRTKNSRLENGHDTSNISSNNSFDNGTSAPEVEAKRSTYIPPKAGMSYRQVFDIQSSDYIFNITPPNYTRHRRYSDSDTESLQNFVSRIIPQDEKPRVLQNIQPKKWMKKVRRKSEDQPKRKMVAQLLNR